MSIPLFPRYHHLCALLLLVAITGARRLSAQCLTNFLYSAPITITNPGDSTLLDYQIKLTINTAALVAAGKLRADGADLRFVDGTDCCAPLPLYIESGMNSAATVVWVRLPRVPAGGSGIISMLYGGGSVRSASSAASVFPLYDDFLGSDLDGSRWNPSTSSPGSGTVALSGGIAHFASGSDSARGMVTITSLDSFATPVIVEMMVTEASGSFAHVAQQIAGSSNGYGLCLLERAMLFGLFSDPPPSPMGAVPYVVETFLSGAEAGDIVGVWGVSWGRTTDEAITWPGGIMQNTEQNYAQLPISPRIVVSLGVLRDMFGQSSGTLSVDWIRVRGYTKTPLMISAPGPELIATTPTILRSPVSRMVCQGEPATFEVATNGGRSFQWRKDGRPIDGATGSSYTVTAATPADTGSYDVVVTGDGCGPAAVTGSARLAFHAPLRVEHETHPETRTLCGGNPVYIRVNAEGALAYQWRKNGLPIDGATTHELTIPSPTAADDGIYDVLVSGGCGASAISATTTLTIIDQPKIIEGPRDTTLCREGRFTLSATVTGPGLRYQWRHDGVPIEGATSPTYTRSAQPQDQGIYDLVVRGACGPAIPSAPARVTVLAEPLIIAQPLSLSVAAGEPATFRVAIDGGGSVSYQWRKDGVDIPGATLPHYTIATVSRDDIGAYSVVVTGTLCREMAAAVVSGAAELTLEGAPAIIAGPNDQHLCAGRPALFMVSAVGSGLHYQWRKDGVPIAGATERRYAIAATTASDAGSYDVTVTSPSGETLRSPSAILSVTAPASITRQPLGGDICAGATATLTVVASGDGLRYQWRRDGSAIPSATTASHTITAAAQSDQGGYDVLVMGDCGDTVTSATATITIHQAAMILLDPLTISAREGEEVTFSVEATGDDVRYAWERDGIVIPGATASHYTIERVTAVDAGSYRAIVTGTCPPADSSAAALLIIDGTSAVPGMPESITGPSLTVLPQPASGTTQLLVKLPGSIRTEKGTRLILYDAMGTERIDLSESFARGRFVSAEFDAGELPSGPYYCRIATGRWEGNIGVVIVTR